MTRPNHARQALKVCRQCAAEIRAAAEASSEPSTWLALHAIARLVEERAAGLVEIGMVRRR